MSFDDHPINRLNAEGAPDFVTLEAAAIYALMAAKFEEETGRTLSPSQTETYMISALAYALTVRGAEEQLAFENCFVAYARTDWLDRHGADRNTPRLEAAAALTRLEFTTAAPAERRIGIPIGTRVSDAAGAVRFRVTEAAAIEIGESSAEAAAAAETPGLIANDFAPGALSTMVDVLPGVDAVANLDATAGGADRESDQRYRARLALAFERISRGGAREAYVAVVLAWSQRVLDVAVIRPEPGHIHLHPLMDAESGAPAPTQAEMDALLDYVIPIAPQGDYLTVLAPASHDFSFALDLVLSDAGAQARAEAAVEAVLATWRRSLGGFIAPSELTCAAKAEAGVIDASIPGLDAEEIAETAWRNGTRNASTVEVTP